jgi:ComF family protein
MGFFATLSDIFFPEGVACIICDGEIRERNRYSICDKCKFEHNSDKICLRCGRAMNNLADYCEDCKLTEYSFERARSALKYSGNTTKLVYGFKFGGKKWLIKFLAPLVTEKLIETAWSADYLTYVPLSYERQKQRGYNQAEILARGVAEAIDIPILSLLKKTAEVPFLAKMSREERIESVKDKYEVTAERAILKGKTIILIDDVLTTGTTANECARTLRKSGAAQVFVLTLASALPLPLV